MEWLNGLQEKLAGAGKVVAHKTKEVADVTKLKVQISAEERKINELYRTIGKKFFQENPDSEEYADEIKAIKEAFHTISSCKEEIEEITAQKGAAKDMEDMFEDESEAAEEAEKTDEAEEAEEAENSEKE